MDPLWTEVAALISGHQQQPCQIDVPQPLGGGCINASYLVTAAGERYVVKVNDLAQEQMFHAESAGLGALGASHCLRVPVPIGVGTSASQAFLVMEWLPLGGQGDMAQFGQQLAAMHRVSADYFGWYRDNTIGSTHQPNTPQHDWLSFWSQQRLGYQLQLAGQRGLPRAVLGLGARLIEGLPLLFKDYRPQPSLLHGDLWSGNYAFTPEGEAVIFDPAVYYGDREADIAMTELFGGFGGEFYRGYQQAWPLDDGYVVRKSLYNLYHILNHFNMFGGGYAQQAEAMLRQLLSECRA